MVTRQAIVDAARACLGTPYQHQGRLPGVALDCAGLPICVARGLGIVPEAFDVTGYARMPDGHALMAHCERWMTRVTRDAMAPGDVFVGRYAHDPQHLGVLGDYLHGGLSLIHALGSADGKGRVVEHRVDDSTLRRFVAAFRMPGVAA